MASANILQDGRLGVKHGLAEANFIEPGQAIRDLHDRDNAVFPSTLVKDGEAHPSSSSRLR
jgi:hypothetical protein